MCKISYIICNNSSVNVIRKTAFAHYKVFGINIDNLLFFADNENYKYSYKNIEKFSNTLNSHNFIVKKSRLENHYGLLFGCSNCSCYVHIFSNGVCYFHFSYDEIYDTHITREPISCNESIMQMALL